MAMGTARFCDCGCIPAVTHTPQKDDGIIYARNRDWLKPSEYDKYYKELDLSQGFDMTSKVGGTLPGGVMVHDPPYDHPISRDAAKDAVKAARFATDKYGLEFVELVKFNSALVHGLMYYITLLAKDQDGLVQTYQAKVLSCNLIPSGHTYVVKIFRKKLNDCRG